MLKNLYAAIPLILGTLALTAGCHSPSESPSQNSYSGGLYPNYVGSGSFIFDQTDSVSIRNPNFQGDTSKGNLYIDAWFSFDKDPYGSSELLLYIGPFHSIGTYPITRQVLPWDSNKVIARFQPYAPDPPIFYSDSGSVTISSQNQDTTIGSFSVRLVADDSSIHRVRGTFTAVPIPVAAN